MPVAAGIGRPAMTGAAPMVPPMAAGPGAVTMRTTLPRGSGHGRGGHGRGDHPGTGPRHRGHRDREADYGSGYRDYGRDRDDHRDRRWVERAGGEVASGFGDGEAGRRRMDELRDDEARDRRASSRLGGRYRDDWGFRA